MSMNQMYKIVGYGLAGIILSQGLFHMHLLSKSGDPNYVIAHILLGLFDASLSVGVYLAVKQETN